MCKCHKTPTPRTLLQELVRKQVQTNGVKEQLAFGWSRIGGRLTVVGPSLAQHCREDQQQPKNDRCCHRRHVSSGVRGCAVRRAWRGTCCVGRLEHWRGTDGRASFILRPHRLTGRVVSSAWLVRSAAMEIACTRRYVVTKRTHIRWRAPEHGILCVNDRRGHEGDF